MNKQGKTTGNLKMRSGPGMQFEPPIAYLVPETALEILGEEGDWWKVRAQGKEGYVGKKYVAVTEAPAEPAAGKDAGSAMGKASEAAGGKPAGDTQGRAPTMPARPAVKPAAPKGIRADASAVEPTTRKPGMSKPSAPKPTASKSPATKASTTKTSATKPNAPRPTGKKR